VGGEARKGAEVVDCRGVHAGDDEVELGEVGGEHATCPRATDGVAPNLDRAPAAQASRHTGRDTRRQVNREAGKLAGGEQTGSISMHEGGWPVEVHGACGVAATRSGTAPAPLHRARGGASGQGRAPYSQRKRNTVTRIHVIRESTQIIPVTLQADRGSVDPPNTTGKKKKERGEGIEGIGQATEGLKQGTTAYSWQDLAGRALQALQCSGRGARGLSTFVCHDPFT